MGAFNGTLNSNEIFSALYNMIISQEVFADNIKGTNSKLLEAARTDGSMYGDTKLYYATDVLESVEWGNDAEASKLLELHRPEDPKCQKITLDKFRQITLTVDDYLSKRAWGTETAFSDFTSVMKGWIRDTKRVYDSTLYNSYIGTATSAKPKQNIELTLTADKEAQEVAQALANLFVELTDVSRDFNDYEQLRSYDMDEIKVIWNSKWVNKIKKIDLPTLFHNEGLMDKFDEYTLPSRYFGTVNSADTAGNGTTVRSLIETTSGGKHIFPGDLVPSGETIGAGNTYTADENIICKIVVKLPPYMSAFEVGTSFFNPKSLTENHYLTWGYNTLEYLEGFPMITVKKAA